MLATWDNVEEILKSKTIIDPVTNCWLWQGTLIDNKYGTISLNYKNEYIHRISAKLYLNFDLEDKRFQINHKLNCPNKHCWNPDHLYKGTQLDNILDRQQTNKQVSGLWGNALYQTLRTHCPQGHEYTPENTRTYKNKRQCIECSKQRDKRRYVKGIGRIKVKGLY